MKINYHGYFTPFGGYGIANFHWVKSLRKLGIEVFPSGKFMPREGDEEWKVLSEEEKEIAVIPYEKQKIGIIETTPFDFNEIDNEIKIANTMAESDILGEPWVNACNAMDYVIVPNEFQYNVFLNSGVSKDKLKIIPHGTDTERYSYMPRERKKDVFTFGIVGWLDERKGAFEVIRAFASEFEPSEPVELILKTSNKAFGYYSQFRDNRIKTINTLMSPDELLALYENLDCFVFPSKAEGIGQPPREAMATGLPTIVTNYSGLEEIALPEISYPLQPIGFSDRKEWVEQPGKWAEIDIQELMYQMRYVYEHQEEAKIKGKKASEYINKNASWELAAGKMKRFLETIDK